MRNSVGSLISFNHSDMHLCLAISLAWTLNKGSQLLHLQISLLDRNIDALQNFYLVYFTQNAVSLLLHKSEAKLIRVTTESHNYDYTTYDITNFYSMCSTFVI